MNEERWDEKALDVSAQAQSCPRVDDLIAYLYGEAAAAEAKDFEHHMQHCASCRTELSAFKQVRGSIIEWRQQSLGTLGSPAFGVNNARALDTTKARREPQRSALAALREFITLSPSWMRAATAAASVIICALAVLAVAHAEFRWDGGGLSFRTGLSRERVVERTQTVEVEKPVTVGYSQEEVERIVADRVRQERESLRDQGASQTKIATTRAVVSPNNAGRNISQPAKDSPRRTPQRQAVAQREPQEEEDIPRLYDLLGESN